jgi:RHS repeat-associated protein
MQITNDGGPNTDGMPMTKMAQAITGNSGMLVDNKFKYNGKELQDELGLNLYDYGARNYDPELGRWINVDPLTEKYYSLSPYNYVGNMPVMAYDPNGKNLVLTGEAKYTTQMVNTLNDGLGNKYVKIDSKGNVTIKKLSTNEMGKLNAQQKALYGIIKHVVNIKETVSIEVVSSSDAVVIGDYDSERIDIADVNAFGEGKAVNQYSILGHEIAEQEIKQVLFDDYDLAHSDGVNAENSISGYKRGDEDSSKLTDVSRKEKYSGQLNIKFKGKKDVVTATIHLINNNVVKVERK